MQLFGGGDEFAKKKDITFRNLITPWQGNTSDKNWNTGKISNQISIDATYHDSLGNVGYKVNTTQAWTSFVPIVKVYVGKWYTFTMNAKILQCSGNICFYTNTGQYTDDKVVDLNSWKLKINDTRIMNLRESNGFQFKDYIEQNKLLNKEFKITITFKTYKTGKVGLALESDSSDLQYYGSSYDLRATPWLEEFNDLQNQISQLKQSK